jgi:hypothetical protein
MKTIRVIFGIWLALVVFVFPAWAAPTTFVSGKGNNTNACSLTAPCRTFAKAVSKTDSGGEVVVLNSAEYGPVTITKSISIIAPQGVYAAINVLSGNGITINAGTSIVALKGLSIISQGGDNGIQSNAVGTLLVENCSVSGFIGYGIVHLAPDSNLIVRDSALQNNHTGIEIDNISGTVKAAIDRTKIDSNYYGFNLYPTGSGTARATVSNSTASNCGYGFQNLYSSQTSQLNLESCIVSNNIGIGVTMDNYNPSSYTAISNCTITNNYYGVYRGNSTFYTMSNNKIIGNYTGDVFGQLTSWSLQ